MTAEGTACNGAGEAPKAEFPPEKAVAASPEEEAAAAASPEEKAAGEREGEDVGGPFVIVNGGDSDGHSDRGSDLDKAPDVDSPSEEEDVPGPNAAPDTGAAEDHGASAGEASAPSAALATSSADGADRAADGSEGGVDESKGEPSSDFITVAAQQEAAGEEHGEAAATAASGSDPAVTSADSKAPALGSEVEAKEDTVDESVATDIAESVVHKAVNEEQDGEDAAPGSCEHDDALSSAKSSSAVKESEVIGEDSNKERSAADVAEPLGQGTGGAIALVENGHICADMSADSIEDATEPESQEDAAVESLGHDDAPMYASAAMDSEVNGEDSREEQSATDIVEVVEGDIVEVVEGTDDVCALMANGHVCADITADSFEASTKPDSHAEESKLEQNVTEIAESVERDAACEDGTNASQTNGHMVASESEFHAIDTEGQETDQQEEGALTSQADVSEGPLEAASIEEPIGEEVNAHGHSNEEGSSNKQVEGEAICGIIQLDKKLGNNSVDSSYEESGVVSSNEGVEKAINEGVPDMCGLEEVTENTSQETVQGDGFIKDGVSICTDPSVKSNLEHNVRAEVATVDETAADDNVVEAETAARGVEEILVKDEADLTPFLSQQNCESSTETVEHEKIEAPGQANEIEARSQANEIEAPSQANEIEAPSQSNEIEAPSQSNEIEAPSQSNEIEAPSQSNEIEAPSQSNEIEAPSQSNEIENDVAEGEVKKEAAREVVDDVPLQEAATSAVSTFHNEPRSIDLVGSMIGHSSPVTELEPCDHGHTDVKQLVSVTSPEHGTVVDNEAEITSEKENGSQEKSSEAAVDQVEPVELKGELVEDDNAQAGGICKKDESSESANVGGSKSHKNQSEICNPSNMSNEGSNIIGDEVPSPIDEVDETCSVTCTETVNESIKSTNEVETKGLEALEPSSICTAVPAEDKGNDQHAPGGLHGDHAEVIGPHRVYLIKTPRFAGEDLWAKTQAAQAHLDKLTQERDAINRRKQKQKVVCDQFRERLEAARLEEREARAAHGDKKNDLNGVKSVIGKMHQANSIEEIDELIAMKERTVQHETISLPEEKNLIKDIKNLKARRKQLSSSMGSKAEINEAFSQKDHIHERHKELKKDSDVLFTNLKSLEENTRKILKSFENERVALRKLNEEYRAANELRQKAYSEWSELKAEPWKKNQCFFAYREDRRKAEGYKTSGDMHKLRLHCNDQIKRVMEVWNENEDFRKQYVEANKFSTLRRLGTVDGRRLGPDEDPPVIPNNRPMNTSPLTASSPDIPTLTSVPAPELAAPASVPAKEDSFPVLPSPQISKRTKSKASGSSAQNENNAVTTLEAEDIKQTEKEKARLMEEQLELARKAEELARKEEELRKERAAAQKERLRLEQKAKAKEAEERKRRKAEKDKERAEFKARKEAEEKEKKKSKKDKKKGPAPAESSAVGDSNAAASATTDTDSNASDNPRDVEVPQSAAPKRLSRPAAAIKQLNRVQPMPAPLRNRGKRRMRQYILIAAAVLSVLALFMAGNYIPRMKSLHY